MNSKRRKKQKACGNKGTHTSFGAAMAAINKTLEKHFIFHRMKPYRCKYCKLWHIGRSRAIVYTRFDELIKPKGRKNGKNSKR